MRPLSFVARVVLLGFTLAALVGCQNPATKISDPDLAAVLGGGQDIAADTVDCLRAWSGDPTLTKGLPADQLAGPRKQDCRRTVESWLTVGQRNPHKLSFDDLADPKVVTRVVAIEQQQRSAAEERGRAMAAEKKRMAEAAASAARKRATTARIAELRKEFDSTLADLRAECAHAEDAVKHKRRVPDNLGKQIDACSTKADAQQQQWAEAVSRNDLTAATQLLKAAHESVTGAKSLATNAAKVRR
ncbi:MAG: hypothetical protein WBW61_04720 [Rhodanobacteraceae bacterium]